MKIKAVNGICKLCLKQRLLRKSHIITNALYKSAGVFHEGKGFELNYDRLIKGLKPVRRPSGYYEYLLCGDCENLIQNYEDYGINFFFYPDKLIKQGLKVTKDFHYSNLMKSPVLKFSNVNYTKFKLFFLSMLWRSSVCSLIQFDNCKLTTEENGVLREMVLNRNAGNETDFQIMILRTETSHSPFENTVTPLFKINLLEGMGNANACYFTFAGFIVFIKLSNNITVPQFQTFTIRKNNECCVLISPFQLLKRLVDKIMFNPNTTEPNVNELRKITPDLFK